MPVARKCGCSNRALHGKRTPAGQVRLWLLVVASPTGAPYRASGSFRAFVVTWIRELTVRRIILAHQDSASPPRDRIPGHRFRGKEGVDVIVLVTFCPP